LQPLKALQQLETIELDHSPVEDLGPLRDLDLGYISLRSTNVKDLSPLAGMSELRTVDFADTKVIDVQSLGSLSLLQTLGMSGSSVTDISPLANCRILSKVDLSGTAVHDLTPLYELPSLSAIDLNYALTAEEVAAFRQAQPKCRVANR
jgi:internalin A